METLQAEFADFGGLLPHLFGEGSESCSASGQIGIEGLCVEVQGGCGRLKR